MSYSILRTGKTDENGVDHYFSREEWDAYEYAPPESVEKFRDLRAGLFLHVGISAVGKVDISWSRRTHKLPDGYPGKIPDERYDGWAKKLKFERFDAEEWITIAKNAGFRYVVVITKHHDGFHMWDTALSEHKITNTPFGRDYLKEIADACHKLDMPLGFYFSQRDWYHPDYEPVDPAKARHIDAPPHFRMNAGETFAVTDKHKRFIEYMRRAVRELMTDYGRVDLLWWDCAWCGGMFLKEMWDAEAIEREVRGLQPHIVVNNRNSLPGDFDTPECVVGTYQPDRAWETCMPLGPCWAWTGAKPKSLKLIIRQMANSACGGGNYLLSVGCTPDGRLGKADVKRLLKLGEWLKKYGESIYDTRAGSILPDGNIGSTQNDEYLYIHCFNKNRVELDAALAEGIEQTALTGEKLKIVREGSKLIVRFRRAGPDTILRVKK